jgi:hypothetical protein
MMTVNKITLTVGKLCVSQKTARGRGWCIGLMLGTVAVTGLAAAPPDDWPMFGQNPANTAARHRDPHRGQLSFPG